MHPQRCHIGDGPKQSENGIGSKFCSRLSADPSWSVEELPVAQKLDPDLWGSTTDGRQTSLDLWKLQRDKGNLSP